MFELLLQADKALAAGSFDQAERTYWQLIELDPTNAIAVAGLARVSLERGDERLARTFADRALGLDPESIAARRVVEMLEHKPAGPARPEPPELPLRAAERLEALGRRHRVGGERSEESGAAGQSEPQKGAARTKAAARPGPASSHEEAEAGKTSRGRTQPDQIVPLPSEPLRERRQAGRLAAAAAAAAAAAREPLHPHQEPHHAMPMGRRLFDSHQLNAPPSDAFFAAEMAAAVEAVDALDETGPVEAYGAPATAPLGERAVGGLADVLRGVDATEADHTVALRIALVADAAELEAAEREAAEQEAAHFAGEAEALEPPDDEPGADEFEAAEAQARGQARMELGPRPTAETGADEFEAAEAQARGQARMELGPRPDETTRSISVSKAALDAAEPRLPEPEVSSSGISDADAAEAAAVAEAVREVARTAAAEPETTPVRRPFKHTGDQEPSEAEAEAQALREALAIVLEGEGEVGAAEVPARSSNAAGSEEPAVPDGSNEAPANTGPSAEADTGNDSPRRKQGLFRRFRGN